MNTTPRLGQSAYINYTNHNGQACTRWGDIYKIDGDRIWYTYPGDGINLRATAFMTDIDTMKN